MPASVGEPTIDGGKGAKADAGKFISCYRPFGIELLRCHTEESRCSRVQSGCVLALVNGEEYFEIVVFVLA